MFHNEMEDLEDTALLDDSATLEPINYEAELKKFDEKLSYKFESFYKEVVQAHINQDQGPGNMLETLRMKIRLLGEDSKLAKKKQDEVKESVNIEREEIATDKIGLERELV